MAPMAKLLYVTDLHGARWKYERTLALARELGAFLVVNGGDMLPHGRMHDDQDRFLREFLDPHFASYESAGIRHLGMPANDDLRVHDALFDSICAKYPAIGNLGGRRIPVGPYDFIGMNLVTDFPFRLKDRARMDAKDFVFPRQAGPGLFSRADGWEEIPDWPGTARALPTIEEELRSLPAPRDPRKAVYVIHGPPSDLGLDVCRGGAAVGSPATRRFLEERRPLLSLHGHIHESPEESGVWKATVGDTVCIQPGQSGDVLTVVVGDLDSMTFERRFLA